MFPGHSILRRPNELGHFHPFSGSVQNEGFRSPGKGRWCVGGHVSGSAGDRPRTPGTLLLWAFAPPSGSSFLLLPSGDDFCETPGLWLELNGPSSSSRLSWVSVFPECVWGSRCRRWRGAQVPTDVTVLPIGSHSLWALGAVSPPPRRRRASVHRPHLGT